MSFYQKKYDIIVIGGGHSGCESASVASKMGLSTLLITLDLDKIAAMPCSPSIGGTAKGQLVKEVDALGGIMGFISDSSAIQYKTLNTKKGIAVHSTRTQNDKSLYHIKMKSYLESLKNLDIKQGLVEEIIVENGEVKGVRDNTNFCYRAKAVILAAGTFLDGIVHIGEKSISAGRMGEFASNNIPKILKKLGFQLGRMKTGTPPRLDKSTIDFSKFTEHTYDKEPKFFSYKSVDGVNLQLPSYIGYTNEKNIKLILDNIKKSPLYSGTIKGVSARYCPSFEDKAVKFPHRLEHRVVLEPEGLNTKEIYASGLGNSMPPEIQYKFVRLVKGLEEAEIMRFAYAIEYDYIIPLQLKPTLETKTIKGLFTAGQVNGTSGYEEAAAQGIWAGINASCKILKLPPFILDRAQSYMGVMVDDLVTKGTKEPYRMFTSRAEYRLMLREDNVYLRLSEIAFKLGLIDSLRFEEIKERKKEIESEIKRVNKTFIKPSNVVNNYLKNKNSNEIKNGVLASQLLKRAELDYGVIDEFCKNPKNLNDISKKQVEIEVKYEGYIKRQKQEIKKFKNLEKIKIPEKFDFKKVYGLSNEIKEKFHKIKPINLGQASRVEGVTPAAISVLMIALKKRL